MRFLFTFYCFLSPHSYSFYPEETLKALKERVQYLESLVQTSGDLYVLDDKSLQRRSLKDSTHQSQNSRSQQPSNFQDSQTSSLVWNDLVSPRESDILIKRFWDCHNNFFPPVCPEYLYHDGSTETEDLYSPYLHTCILAAGFLYAIQDGKDVETLATEVKDSKIYDAAKQLAEHRPTRTNRISDIQALYVMGDLEYKLGDIIAARQYLSLWLSSTLSPN